MIEKEVIDYLLNKYCSNITEEREDAEEKLIAHFDRKIKRYANRLVRLKSWNLLSCDVDEIIVEGQLGIFRACEKIITYGEITDKVAYIYGTIYKSMKYEVINLARDKNNQNFSLNAPILSGKYDSTIEEFINNIKDESVDEAFDMILNTLKNNTLLQELENLMKKSLNSTERNLIRAYYGFGEYEFDTCDSIEKLVEKFKIKRNKVEATKAEGMRKLRNSNWVRDVGVYYYYYYKVALREKDAPKSKEATRALITSEDGFSKWNNSLDLISNNPLLRKRR